ncbi:MAG: replication initiator protein A [Magnetococcales bacterium]|nr:replication initiator protein A [Magnetococcales bacterium]
MNKKKTHKKTKAGDKQTIESVRQQLILPLWPETDRAIPNSIARSALFSVVKRGPRRIMDKEPVAAWSDVTMIYSGERLDQADLDVWLQVAHMAMNRTGQQPADPVLFSAHSFLKSIGRSTGKSQYQWLERSLSRMHRSHVNLEHPDAEYHGYLVPEYSTNRITRQIAVTLNPRLIAIFGDQNVTRVVLETRLSLKNDLAKWLYTYVSSQSSPHRIHLTQLKPLCGMESNLKDFRRALKRDMDVLLRTNVVSKWFIDTDGHLNFERPDSHQGLIPPSDSA